LNYLIYSILVITSINTFAALDRGQFNAGPQVQDARVYDEIIKLDDGRFKIINPRLKTVDGVFPIMAYTNKICQAFGYMGGSPSEVELEITDKVNALYLYTTIRSKDYTNIDPNSEISVSYNFKETMGSIERFHFHYAKSVVCSNLKDLDFIYE
jgi:hypothetical protein